MDFAHVYARNNGKIDYKEIAEQFHGHIHAHFSGIEFSAKGERNHKITPESEIKKLLRAVKHRDITIINESPDPVGDTLKAKKLLN